ncbi:hypothetical protein I532_17053 [Brevibacillus borstelensis AK1]|uniref:Uncharacterized protein n=1 Tax=Brevibacillus borstelensis AK1 TaxID=1300222 RepID=M8DDX5_9BACL|nr:hypothetical protein I532_17053 [Brevibacillus borstelensis AK1]
MQTTLPYNHLDVKTQQLQCTLHKRGKNVMSQSLKVSNQGSFPCSSEGENTKRQLKNRDVNYMLRIIISICLFTEVEQKVII